MPPRYSHKSRKSRKRGGSVSAGLLTAIAPYHRHTGSCKTQHRVRRDDGRCDEPAGTAPRYVLYNQKRYGLFYAPNYFLQT
jgi:hypothetical protein